jgi:hypothetical protein
VTPQVIFLRTTCLLPEGLDLIPKQFSESWVSIEKTTSAALDVKVRGAGWQFMWLREVCSSLAFGQTEASAVSKATSRALKGIKTCFNAADFEELAVSRYPGFKVARVTLCARHIQQDALLSPAGNTPVRKMVLG